nr:PREDICTED: replication factor A protein 1-like [Daucus carota subsp. sativus]
MALPGFAAHLRLQRTRFAPLHKQSTDRIDGITYRSKPRSLQTQMSSESRLDDHTEDWMIKVRVCRKWESVNTKDGNLISLDMILIDEKENLMHASVRKHLVPRYADRVLEGRVYSLRNLKVTTNMYPYRPLASDVKLLFLATTAVQELQESDVSIGRYGFEFVNQTVLQSRANDPTVLSDIVGCFTGFEGIETVRSGSKKRDIQILTDYSVNSTVTLWGKLGEEFDPALYTQDSGPYVIVVSSVTVKRFRQGSLTFSTTSASKVYINPEVDHVTSIKERFSALSIQAKPIQGTSAAKLTPEEEMFINRMTVDALVKATGAGEMKESVVTLKATITGINSGQGWYYIACRSCVKKAEFENGVYVCRSCGTLEYPLALYRVKAEVQDRTGTTTVVMFNYPAENLLDTSAKKLLGKMKPGDDSVPKELNTLLGKELVFKLKLDKYNLIEGLQDYRVSTVFTPVEGLEAVYAQKEARKENACQSGPATSSNTVLTTEDKKKRKRSSCEEDASQELGEDGSQELNEGQ